jgi:type VI protein secretion system component Hcp
MNARTASRFVAGAAVMLALSVPALAATKITMTVIGAGFPGSPIPVISVKHDTRIPVGLSADKRTEGVVTVVRQTDALSLRLSQAAARNEILREITVSLFGSASSDSGKPVDNIVINDAVIKSIHLEGTRETITISYKTITVTNGDGGKGLLDDWRTP